MRRLILGTAGHIDHGKTRLVQALTGVDTDRLAEEKRRGITIDLGFAKLALEGGIELGVVDVPGHEGFIRNMLAGATGIDLVMLVVAADEGVMPQTREHLAIVELLGVRGGVVAVTKTDLVERDWLGLVVEEIRERLRDTPFATAPVIPVSAETGEGLDALREALRDAASAVRQRAAEDLFRLPVDRVFTVRGTGTVVTGTIWSGRIAREQTVGVLPEGAVARVRGIQLHGRETDTAEAGQRAALALGGADRDRIRRGSVLVGDGAWQATRMLTARVSLLRDTGWRLRTRQRVRFHLGTAEVMARVMLLDETGAGAELGPGAAAWAQLRLEAPVVARAGDRFVIRSYSPVTTIGGGIIAEPTADKRKRLGPADAAVLDAVITQPAADAVTALCRAAGPRGAAIARLPTDTPHPPHEIEAALAALEGTTLVRVGERAFAADIASETRTRLLAGLEAFHTAQPLRPGMDREELRRTLPATTARELGEWALAGLLADGAIVSRGGLVARAGHAPRLSDDQRRIRDRLLDTLDAAGLTPPPIAELPDELRAHPDFRTLLKLLEHEDAIVAVTPELYFTRAVIDGVIATVRRELAGRDGLTPADFRAVLPLSRKFLIPILEFLDRGGITHRRGDERAVAD
ncbi:MAG TPA: selenocysteine-specific translation elongation factor [Longimicrobiales bacterium]